MTRIDNEYKGGFQSSLIDKLSRIEFSIKRVQNDKNLNEFARRGKIACLVRSYTMIENALEKEMYG